jgi:rhodanese-related sulfurtransferase
MCATELEEYLSIRDRPILLDVREDHELTNGTLQGSVHIPMQNIAEKLADVSDNKDATIVVICRTGNRSNSVGQFLEQNGFTDVINLAGGMNAWALDVDPDMAVY